MLLGKTVGYTLGLSSGKKHRLPSSLIRLRPNRGFSTPSSPPSTALQSWDLLQTYRGLVELGKIQSNDNQIRVVMQVRLLMSPLLVLCHCVHQYIAAQEVTEGAERLRPACSYVSLFITVS